MMTIKIGDSVYFYSLGERCTGVVVGKWIDCILVRLDPQHTFGNRLAHYFTGYYIDTPDHYLVPDAGYWVVDEARLSKKSRKVV